MANTSFLDLTNRLLRRLNEVEISQANFGSTKGVQSLAKDAINASIDEINAAQNNWPFNLATTTQVLTAGTASYSYPTDMQLPEYGSFKIVANSSLNVSTDYRVPHVPRATQQDFLVGAFPENDKPQYFMNAGSQFTLFPTPDQAYTLSYAYYKRATRLSNYNDVSTIPSRYDETIIQGALFHMYMFRDNASESNIALKLFQGYIGQMRTQLTNDYSVMQSTMNVYNNSGFLTADDGYFHF